jgi:hypothetical protein
VEFIGPKEAWEESRLLKKLVLRLELLLARELIRQGQGDWRAAVTLLEYGTTAADFQAALEGLIKGAPAL